MKNDKKPPEYWKQYSDPRPKSEKVERDCLKCDRPFVAKNKYTRVCPACKGSSDYESPEVML